MQRLKVYYEKVVFPLLVKEFNYNSYSNISRLNKIVINRGVDQSCQNLKVLDSLLSELLAISGQKPFLIRSKKSISNFKVRQNMPIGMSVTLRRFKMYSFLDRLINLVFPRIRDFQGLNIKGFDSYGNFSFSFEDQLMFPEVDFDKVLKLEGFDFVMVINSKSSQESFFLLKSLGFPFQLN